MSLTAEIRLQRGDLDLDVAFEVANGEVVALLGPNGAGKSTVLRALAGLAPLEDGRIEVDGRVLDDPGAGVFVDPAERGVGVVFQDPLLFPHLSVEANVAFGLRARGRSREVATAVARAWLEQVGLVGVGSARPRELSGGQAQRVALARALATEPRLLLLDEPMAALDAQARPALRALVGDQLTEFGGLRLLVTHDPLDAVLLADRLVIVEEGRVVQTGTTAEVVARPRTQFVADLMGINLVRGEVSGARTVRLTSGAELTVAEEISADGVGAGATTEGDAGGASVPTERRAPCAGSGAGTAERLEAGAGRASAGTPVALAIAPSAVALHAERPSGSPRNVWAARVAEVQADRDRVRVTLDGPVPLTAEVTPASVAELGLRRGATVWASVKAVEVAAYPLGRDTIGLGTVTPT